MLITLRPVLAEDADALYEQVAGTPVTDTILWDGPTSLAAYREALAARAAETAAGALHLFTVVAGDTLVGNVDVRPEDDFRGQIGLWIGAAHQGRGFGSAAVAAVTDYAFGALALRKLEAKIFVGNLASRRIFEKNHFQYEGTIRRAACKRGVFVDEWLLGLLNEEWGA